MHKNWVSGKVCDIDFKDMDACVPIELCFTPSSYGRELFWDKQITMKIEPCIKQDTVWGSTRDYVGFSVGVPFCFCQCG